MTKLAWANTMGTVSGGGGYGGDGGGGSFALGTGTASVSESPGNTLKLLDVTLKLAPEFQVANVGAGERSSGWLSPGQLASIGAGERASAWLSLDMPKVGREPASQWRVDVYSTENGYEIRSNRSLGQNKDYTTIEVEYQEVTSQHADGWGGVTTRTDVVPAMNWYHYEGTGDHMGREYVRSDGTGGFNTNSPTPDPDWDGTRPPLKAH